jgi:hypothetical protein
LLMTLVVKSVLTKYLTTQSLQFKRGPKTHLSLHNTPGPSVVKRAL